MAKAPSASVNAENNRTSERIVAPVNTNAQMPKRSAMRPRSPITHQLFWSISSKASGVLARPTYDGSDMALLHLWQREPAACVASDNAVHRPMFHATRQPYEGVGELPVS